MTNSESKVLSIVNLFSLNGKANLNSNLDIDLKISTKDLISLVDEVSTSFNLNASIFDIGELDTVYDIVSIIDNA